MHATLTQPPGVRLQFARPAEDSNTLRTDIAAFAGPTERGPQGELVRVAGWLDYLARFGELTELASTAFALRGYFENEGEIAYVVRTVAAALPAWADWTVGARDPVTGAWLPSAPASAGFTAGRYRIEASSPGVWANGLDVTIAYRRFGVRATAEVDMIIRTRHGTTEVLSGLSPATLADDVAARSALIRLVADPGAAAKPAAHAGPLGIAWPTLRLGGGTEQPPGRAEYLAALALMLAEPEAALLAFPDIDAMDAPVTERDAVLAAAVIGAERRMDRQVIACAPPHVQRTGEVAGWLAAQRDRFGERGVRAIAVYHPRVDVDDPFGGIIAPLRRISAVGHVAGVISRLDRERGAHHTPANVPLHGAVDVANHFNNPEQALLTGIGANVLRCQAGRGLLVWGGRTLSDPALEPENLYLAHRRLVHRLVRAIRRAAEPLVFETNGPDVWLALVRAVSTVLMQAYRAGALKGERPSEGFSVLCDESNNPPASINAGMVVCEIQVAPATPMEFITLRISLSSDGRLEMIEP
ncbi:phage tail protein [Massilia sp. CCM 8733]|uniref:Phage tail protein n=1 Tax=Massilia mucilaginosa TaxID=2609282 RepID=A0ABX0NSA5_9BURK|nr:phage tail sheath subtilisin-like domain-containing protein [Massilia mucilaginosa]NHZ89638.1 phage tail protein [Massilia mucilaginosa]